jgi:hypothetical protein
MFTSDSNPETSICNQGKQFVSWALEMPTPEQKLSTIQQARKNGNEEAAVQFFNRLSKDAAKQVVKASQEKSDTKTGKPTANQSAQKAKTTDKKPAQARALWPWVLVVSGLLSISVGVAAMLHPELTNQFAADLNKLFDSKTYEPKVKPEAKIELPAEKSAEATGGPTNVQGELPAPVLIAPPPTPAAVEPVQTPPPPAPAPLPLTSETPVPAKPEKVITELPEGAVQGRLWLKGLPDDSYVLQHGTYASLKQARAAMKDKDWLVNARVVPVFTDGKDEAEFLGHEVVRQFGNLLEVVIPPPQGDWGYFPRRAQDIAVRTLRQLIAKYGHRGEPLGEFEVRAMHIVRLYMEEAVHRHLLSARGANVRAGICGFMLTMRNFEQDTLPQDVGTMGLFCSMTESNLRELAMRIARGENTSVENMPSYAAAMRNIDMKHEVFSLIPVRTWPGSVAMTTAEIRAMSAASGRPLRSDSMVPGRPAGASLFGGIFRA